MVREYHVYRADIWASVVGEKMTNSHLEGGILADCCSSMHLAYCHLSHFPQTRYCRRLTGVDGSTGVHSNARNTIRNAIACSLLPRVWLPVPKFDIKISTVFIFVHQNIRKFAPYDKFPLYGICPINMKIWQDWKKTFTVKETNNCSY